MDSILDKIIYNYTLLSSLRPMLKNVGHLLDLNVNSVPPKNNKSKHCIEIANLTASVSSPINTIAP